MIEKIGERLCSKLEGNAERGEAVEVRKYFGE